MAQPNAPHRRAHADTSAGGGQLGAAGAGDVHDDKFADLAALLLEKHSKRHPQPFEQVIANSEPVAGETFGDNPTVGEMLGIKPR